MFFVDAGGSGNNRSMVVTNNGTPVVGYSADSTLNRSVLAAWNKLSGSTPDLFYNGISQSLGSTRIDLGFTGGSINFGWNNRSAGKYQQELIIYTTASSVNREPIQYNINSYFNVFTQSANFSTSSFAIYATTSSISASINNELQSGIASSGPLGFITVSRTGSNSLTLARNGVTSSFAVPASGALSTNLYLGAINNNGLALGSSPYNISFASVGTGLTGAETIKYFNLVNSLQYNLGREVDTEYLAILQYAIDEGYTIPSPDQRALQNKLLTDLKRAGIWDKLDGFYIYATDGDADYAKLDWKNPNIYPTTVTGTVTLAKNIGLEVGNTVSSINARYINTKPNSNFSTTNACYYYYPYLYAGSISMLGGNQSFLRVRDRNTGEVNINGTANTSGTYVITGNRALKSVQFTAPQTMVITNGKTRYNITTATTALTPYDVNGAVSFSGPSQFSLFAYGATLVDENSDFVDAVESYLAAISS
jgi:hypothetical protein